MLSQRLEVSHGYIGSQWQALCASVEVPPGFSCGWIIKDGLVETDEKSFHFAFVNRTNHP